MEGKRKSSSRNKNKWTQDYLLRILECLFTKENKELKKILKEHFPVGTELNKTTTEEFFEKYILPEQKKIYALEQGKRVLATANNEGIITQNSAKQAIHKFQLDQYCENARSAFENIKSILPKQRLKCAAKWFGISIGISLAMNMIFSLFKHSANKK